MHEGFNIWIFLSGLPLGGVIASIILYLSWRKGKKERRFDERYQTIHQKSKTFSWTVTTVALLIGWMIIILVEGPSLAFFIFTAIWIIHMISYLVASLRISKSH